MTAHDHRTYVEGCYRCELGRDEAQAIAAEERREKAIHAVARMLCFFRNRDWRYDPGNRKHAHWRAKAYLVLAELDRWENGGCHDFPLPSADASAQKQVADA